MRGHTGMRGNRLLGSLAFAAFAALASIPWTMVTVPVLWPSRAVGLFVLAAAVLHVVWIAPSWPRGARIGALAALLAALVAVLAPGLTATVLGAAAILAVARSGFLYRAQPARALVLEVALIAGGLVFARVLGGPTSLGLALGIWGFFLVQSLFFVAGGVRERQAEASAVDPFERARRKALAVLEDPAG